MLLRSDRTRVASPDATAASTSLRRPPTRLRTPGRSPGRRLLKSWRSSSDSADGAGVKTGTGTSTVVETGAGAGAANDCGMLKRTSDGM
jgi:hypothetical protein